MHDEEDEPDEADEEGDDGDHDGSDVCGARRGSGCAIGPRPGACAGNGQTLSLSTENGQVRVDGATVTSADIVCANGVIHVIDQVVLPK